METYIERLRTATEAVGTLTFDRRFTAVATAERLLRLNAELKERYSIPPRALGVTSS